MIVCDKCGKHLDAKEVDEYTPEYFEEGFAIPYDNLPEDKDEIHIWRTRQRNLMMHFVNSGDKQ